MRLVSLKRKSLERWVSHPRLLLIGLVLTFGLSSCVHIKPCDPMKKEICPVNRDWVEIKQRACEKGRCYGRNCFMYDGQLCCFLEEGMTCG